MKFPDFRIVDPLKSPLGLGGSNMLGSYNSQINPHLPAKFVCSPTSCRKGGGVQTDIHTKGHCSFTHSILFVMLLLLLNYFIYNTISRKRML